MEQFDNGGISIDDDFDKQATELLELEAELTSLDGAAVDAETTYESGTVVGAQRVQITAVPDSYPVYRFTRLVP